MTRAYAGTCARSGPRARAGRRCAIRRSGSSVVAAGRRRQTRSRLKVVHLVGSERPPRRAAPRSVGALRRCRPSPGLAGKVEASFAISRSPARSHAASQVPARRGARHRSASIDQQLRIVRPLHRECRRPSRTRAPVGDAVDRAHVARMWINAERSRGPRSAGARKRRRDRRPAPLARAAACPCRRGRRSRHASRRARAVRRPRSGSSAAVPCLARRVRAPAGVGSGRLQSTATAALDKLTICAGRRPSRARRWRARPAVPW